MAGMLPGVECARRRRFHQSGAFSDSPTTSAAHASRRSSFCLYTTNHEVHLTSFSSMQRITLNQEYLNEKLAEVAREAKERLNEKLKAKGKSETKRTDRQERLKGGEGRSMVLGDLKIEVFGVKKRGLKRFSWQSLGRKSRPWTKRSAQCAWTSSRWARPWCFCPAPIGSIQDVWCHG